MKIIRQVSREEMEEKFPDLLAAYEADPKDTTYCVFCDGTRLKNHICKCWVCGLGKEECHCLNP